MTHIIWRQHVLWLPWQRAHADPKLYFISLKSCVNSGFVLQNPLLRKQSQQLTPVGDTAPIIHLLFKHLILQLQGDTSTSRSCRREWVHTCKQGFYSGLYPVDHHGKTSLSLLRFQGEAHPVQNLFHLWLRRFAECDLTCWDRVIWHHLKAAEHTNTYTHTPFLRSISHRGISGKEICSAMVRWKHKYCPHMQTLVSITVHRKGSTKTKKHQNSAGLPAKSTHFPSGPLRGLPLLRRN